MRSKIELRRLQIRLPLALFLDIADDAQRRDISMNREIIRRCSYKRWANQSDRQLGIDYQPPLRPTPRNTQPLNGATPAE